MERFHEQAKYLGPSRDVPIHTPRSIRGMVGHAPLLPQTPEAQLMGMSMPRPITTVAELLALPEDGKRHELLDSVHYVTSTPGLQHQRAARDLSRLLEEQCDNRRDLEVFGVPGDIQLNERTVVEPDVFVLRRDREHPYTTWAEAPVPLLVVEILSPTTAARDRGVKRRLYLEAGVEQYWIVDIDARTVERWCQGDDRPEMLDERLEWSLSAGVTGSIELPKLFASVTLR